MDKSLRQAQREDKLEEFIAQEERKRELGCESEMNKIVDNMVKDSKDKNNERKKN